MLQIAKTSFKHLPSKAFCRYLSDTPLSGRIAIVTGSTSGIGAGIAETLAKQGCNIVLNGFGDSNEIEKQRQALSEKHNIEVAYHGADLSKAESVQDMISTTVERFGKIDIIVNNAGIQVCS